MKAVPRLLHPVAVRTFEDYIAEGGGGGLRAAELLGPDGVMDELEASRLRGRGGAGFPTARKWRTVQAYASSDVRTSVVVNAAEGEPGTFKDRTILRNDPYQVIEGALIAARTLDADHVIIGTKRAFKREVALLEHAIEDVRRAGWADGVRIEVFQGPKEYLYGEETALLETVDGRYPFPRIAPPYRRGVREVVTTETAVTSGSGYSARVVMAGPDEDLEAPPTLVDNVETLANVTWILAKGAGWFRGAGTPESAGTIVCTVTGSTRRHGVAEVPFGTPLREVIEQIGGGARTGRRLTAVLPGVSNAFVPARPFYTPVTYEAFKAIGSGLGSAGFIVFDDRDDLVAAAAGASRFLAVESCGQCVPCKLDGLRIADLLGKLCRNELSAHEFGVLRRKVTTVADSARCALATQQQTLISSMLALYADETEAHIKKETRPVEPALVAELVDIRRGTAVVDEHHAAKQPDWSFNAVPSGKAPAARFGEHRDPQLLDE